MRYRALDFTTSTPFNRISSLPSATPFLVREAGGQNSDPWRCEAWCLRIFMPVLEPYSRPAA
jgi:hypothetical protein